MTGPHGRIYTTSRDMTRNWLWICVPLGSHAQTLSRSTGLVLRQNLGLKSTIRRTVTRRKHKSTSVIHTSVWDWLRPRAWKRRRRLFGEWVFSWPYIYPEKPLLDGPPTGIKLVRARVVNRAWKFILSHRLTSRLVFGGIMPPKIG